MSWGALGMPLGSFGDLLGPLGVTWGARGVLLEVSQGLWESLGVLVGCSWGSLGMVLGPLRMVLEPVEVLLGCSWELLGCPWSALEVSLGRSRLLLKLLGCSWDFLVCLICEKAKLSDRFWPPRGVPGDLLGSLGALLESVGVLLGHLGVLLKPPGVVLGSLGVHLVPLWVLLGLSGGIPCLPGAIRCRPPLSRLCHSSYPPGLRSCLRTWPKELAAQLPAASQLSILLLVMFFEV